MTAQAGHNQSRRIALIGFGEVGTRFAEGLIASGRHDVAAYDILFDDAAAGPALRDKARALAVAKDVGLDMAKLEKDMAGPEVKATIEENFRLAESMGMNGTPSYVIGKQVVIGAIGLDGLKEKISAARCGKATC